MIVLFALLLSVLLAFGRDIKVGFTAVITREDVKTIKDFLDYLSRKTGFSFSPVFARSSLTYNPSSTLSSFHTSGTSGHPKRDFLYRAENPHKV
jgi:hypothetical protein